MSGVKRISLLSALAWSGHTPLILNDASVESIALALAMAKAPCVLFPECTTSNNGALLRFALVPIVGGAAMGVRRPRVLLLNFKFARTHSLSPSCSLGLTMQDRA